MRRIVTQAFPEDSYTAMQIVSCESGWKPNAHNPHNKDGTEDGGLWQINTVHDEALERLGLDKYNPVDATKYARMLYERNGWRDWVCYHKMLAMR